MARDRILQIYRGTTAQNDAFTGAAGELTMDTSRKEIRIHDGSTAGGNPIGLTPGFIAPFAGTSVPDGWLLCDGSAVSRTTYAKLFAVIGTTYGAGDGNSTFNLPDVSDCFVQGGTPGTTHSAGLPNIKGDAYNNNTNAGALYLNHHSGAFKKGSTNSVKYPTPLNAGDSNTSLGFDASLSNSIYGNSTTVQPKSVEMKYCIKY